MALVVTGRLNRQVAGAPDTVEKNIKSHRARVMIADKADIFATAGSRLSR
jgi:FixJ family two-component response regulator